MQYFRTVIEVEILSEDEPWNGELVDLAYNINDGGCSGRVRIKLSNEVTPKRMAQLLQSQGSDPGFFSLDENGNTV